MVSRLESNAVRTAAADRRITIPEAEGIVRKYQRSGTLDPEDGFAIARDVDRLEKERTSVRVSKTAMRTRSGSIPGVQLLGVRW